MVAEIPNRELAGGAINHRWYHRGTDRYVYVSRSPRSVDTLDVLDAGGRIDTIRRPAGGRAVAGSNPVAPTDERPVNEDSEQGWAAK